MNVYQSLTSFLAAQHELWRLSRLQQSPVPLQFPLPYVAIATDLCSVVGFFIISYLGFPYPVFLYVPYTAAIKNLLPIILPNFIQIIHIYTWIYTFIHLLYTLNFREY